MHSGETTGCWQLQHLLIICMSKTSKFAVVSSIPFVATNCCLKFCKFYTCKPSIFNSLAQSRIATNNNVVFDRLVNHQNIEHFVILLSWCVQRHAICHGWKFCLCSVIVNTYTLCIPVHAPLSNLTCPAFSNCTALP